VKWLKTQSCAVNLIPMNTSHARSIFALVSMITLFVIEARASVGLTEITGKDSDDPVTVFYPSSSGSQPVTRGPFTLHVAWHGEPVRRNGRLVVMSHGSGSSPWVYADLAPALVEAGFVIAMPEHRGDNHKDPGTPGSESWKRRPLEVSHAIDAVAQDVRLGPLLALDKVGMYGISAGGHTGLSLADGRWSPVQLKQHCDAHLAEDFQGCVGLTTRLTGGALGGVKKAVATWVIDWKLTDATWYTYQEPRIAAVVVGVPFAADFDPASLAAPRIPLAIISARQDWWLRPQFHSDAILQACRTCERLADFATGGHGTLLSPLPPNLSGLLAELLNDPPNFDRAEVPPVYRTITGFFQKHLLP
jgi:predicted dienelactone hydrolase